ncbi:MAG: ABC transporter permease [Bacteroidetes bacterium]|nr:ABC transporter permease [Bacteroidota bacterium]MBT3933481.1 ABC transporter permease [Bacteroidota bacterium]MBT4728775.1 ABC transporter permease [Bacteroidota bacterium]MBT4968802.1 ABC transporter permease [Bacteroidota bacterium]MBT5992479.1 ABC transporter permease [Bacteroidota bacterium]
MKTYLKLAWRNLWRNKRRTLITVSSIFIAVLLSALMKSMQEGSYESMVDMAVKFYSGAIQVHKDGYWENQTLNNSLEVDDSLIKALDNVEHINFYTPRIESFSLASSENLTKGVMVLGIDPEREDQVTKVKSKLVEGNYLNQNDDGVLLSAGLAKFLKLNLNDTLVLLGQGYHGVSAAGKFPIRGIIKHPNPEFNKMLVYMSIKQCQTFYSAEGLLTSFVIMVDDYDKIPKIQHGLKNQINLSKFEVMNWKEMQPVLVQQIESDKQTAVIFKGILYLVIAFGILGTIMMMMSERKREFGVVIAVGMQKYKLKTVVFIETILIGIVGIITGVVGSFPLTWFFYKNPIPLSGKSADAIIEYGFEPVMYFSIAPSVYLNQAITIFAFTLVIAIYPLYFLGKLKVMDALRS